jgi:hypothetical protein
VKKLQQFLWSLTLAISYKMHLRHFSKGNMRYHFTWKKGFLHFEKYCAKYSSHRFLNKSCTKFQNTYFIHTRL